MTFNKINNNFTKINKKKYFNIRIVIKPNNFVPKYLKLSKIYKIKNKVMNYNYYNNNLQMVKIKTN